VEFGPQNLPIISMEEVERHQRDSWMVLYDKVYDFSAFMKKVNHFFWHFYKYSKFGGTW